MAPLPVSVILDSQTVNNGESLIIIQYAVFDA